MKTITFPTLTPEGVEVLLFAGEHPTQGWAVWREGRNGPEYWECQIKSRTEAQAALEEAVFAIETGEGVMNFLQD